MSNGSGTAAMVYWTVTERAMLSATLLGVMIVSVVGNSLVILVVVRNRGMRTRTNMFLCSLAVADFLCSVLAMPFSLATAMRAEYIFDRALCLATGFMTPLFIVASIHTLMYISVHRFVTVRHPHSGTMTRRRIIGMICAAWAWAIVASAVSISGLTEVNHSDYTTQCAPKYPDDAKSYAHLALAMLTCYLIPMIVIVVCSGGVLREIRAYGRHLRDSSTVDESEVYEQQKHIAVTLILVVVMFIVCWTPLVVYAIYSTLIRDDDRIHHLANPVCWWFGYLNSACNPILYAFRSQAFRDGYRQVVCRQTKGKPRRGSTSTMSSLSLRQRFSNLLHRDSTLSSTVFNANDSVSVPTTPGGTYRSSTGDDDVASRTALMSPGDGQSAHGHVQRSVSSRRPRPQPAVDVCSDLIEMDSFRSMSTDDEENEGRRHAKRVGGPAVSFSDHDMDQSDATSRPAAEQRRKPSLMRFPSLEHLDRMNDGSPWRSTTRRRRKFRGGIGGLQRRGGDATDPTGDDVNDDIELDRVTDVETVPDTSRKPARTTSGVSRTASAAARQRERQLLANRGAQQPPEPENRIYRPVKKPQPLPPPPLAPRPPAPVDRDALRVAGEPSSSADGEATESAASRPRRQRRRRPRGDGETAPQTSAEPQPPAATGTRQPPVHQSPNGSGNVGHDASTEVTMKPEAEVSRGGRGRRSSRRSADSRGPRRTDNRIATVV